MSIEIQKAYVADIHLTPRLEQRRQHLGHHRLLIWSSVRSGHPKRRWVNRKARLRQIVGGDKAVIDKRER